MKSIAAAASILVILTGQAEAASQVRSSNMSCNALKAALAESGALTVPYKSTRAPQLQLFDRFVSSKQFCAGNEVTAVKFIPAEDTSNCPLPRCVPIDCESSGPR